MDCTSCYVTALRNLMQTVAPEPSPQAPPEPSPQAPPKLVYRAPKPQEWEII